MPKLLIQNSKLRKTSRKENLRAYNFGIPAIETCPMAAECAIGCFGDMNGYVFRKTRAAYRWRYEQTLDPYFAGRMIEAITEAKINVLRVHDVGDYYSPFYWSKWAYIMERLPNVHFYSYTKMVKYFRMLDAQGKLPDNFTVIYSMGGKQDETIDLIHERHSMVFPDLETLQYYGYNDASDNDLEAVLGDEKVGLVYHGSKSYENTEWAAVFERFKRMVSEQYNIKEVG